MDPGTDLKAHTAQLEPALTRPTIKEQLDPQAQRQGTPKVGRAALRPEAFKARTNPPPGQGVDEPLPSYGGRAVRGIEPCPRTIWRGMEELWEPSPGHCVATRNDALRRLPSTVETSRLLHHVHAEMKHRQNPNSKEPEKGKPG